MILCEWDAPEGNPDNLRTPVCFRILSSSLTCVSIFSVCCYSIVSISVVGPLLIFFISLRRHSPVWEEGRQALRQREPESWAA